MTSKILVVNGPNLNLLGTREPAMYGAGTLADLEQRLRDEARQLGIDVAFVQSNHEGELIDHIQAARADCTGIVINPAGFTHTSVAIRDALLATELPIAEVHITNVHRREKFRQHSYISDIAEVVIAGAGFEGYALALRRLGLDKENS